MDPFLLAIQISELVGTDVDQGAQVTVISTRKKEDVGLGVLAFTPWTSLSHCLPLLKTKPREANLSSSGTKSLSLG